MSVYGAASLTNDPNARGKSYVMGPRGWLLVMLICALAGLGVAMLYSVADMSWEPWAGRHATRFALGLGLMAALAITPLRWWMIAAYPAYLAGLVLLVAVELYGATNMGAQRWLEVGGLQVQPSELMKLAVVLAIARFYHDTPYAAVRAPAPFIHAIPLAMIAVPALLIVRQPDLGTALLLSATGVTLVFVSGMRWQHILGGAVFGAIGLAVLYVYGLRDYQRQRILTFLDPASDPMGAGYHTLQSRIAIGSGGMRGKGFGEGTQTQLDFLPEKQTDFIFTVIGEELGFIGGAATLALTAAILVLAISIAMRARSHFGRLAAVGVSATFAFYVFINTAMVMGLVPVVGVPLPLVSYGGTVMMTVMAGFGLVLAVHVSRDVELRRGAGPFL